MLRRISLFGVFLFAIVLAAVPLRPLPPPDVVQPGDQARIDWLESNANSCCVEPKVDLAIAGRAFVQGEDLRESIDEACARCAASVRETPVIRMAAVVVRGLLPATAGAQSTAIAVDSPARGTPAAARANHSHAFLWGALAFIVLALAVAFFVSRRSNASNTYTPGGSARPT